MFARLRHQAGKIVGPDTKALLHGLRWAIRESWRFSGKQGLARLRAVVRASADVLSNRTGYIVIWPKVPYHDNFILCKIVGRLRMRPTTSPARAGALSPFVFFRDATCYTPELPGLPAVPIHVLNAKATDIRKSRVEQVFSSVSDDRTFVDPTAHFGLAVEKSEQNGSHDGRVVVCPIPQARPGFVYQRVINNVGDDARAVDYRVAVVGGSIPLVYVKRRPVAERFSNTNERADLARAADVFSAVEIDLILRFAQRFGLDLGELDVLRDLDSGRIYVVDVNNTPFGPPNGLSRTQAAEAVERLAAAFRQAFLSGAPTDRVRVAANDVCAPAMMPALDQLPVLAEPAPI